MGAKLKKLLCAGTLITYSLFNPQKEAIAQVANPIYPQFTTSTSGSLTLNGYNFYGAQITTSSTAGYVLIFDGTTVPADGTVTPVKCFYVANPGTSYISLDPTAPWSSKSNPSGWTIVFSSTGCFTKTISATAFISAQVQ